MKEADWILLDLVVVIVVSVAYFIISLWFGWSIKVWQCDRPCSSSRQIPNLCFAILIVGFLNNVWAVVMDRTALATMKDFQGLQDGVNDVTNDGFVNTDNVMADENEIETELRVQEFFQFIFDIGFVALGVFVVSGPWESFYKTGARIGAVVLLAGMQVMFAISYITSHANDRPNIYNSGVAQVMTVFVEFCVLIGIMIGWMVTLHSSRNASSTAQPTDMIGYKTYGYLLGFHLLTRIIIVVATIIYGAGLVVQDDDGSGQDPNNAPDATLFVGVLEMVLIRITPLLVVTGVSCHWSSVRIEDGFEGLDQDQSDMSPAIQLT